MLRLAAAAALVAFVFCPASARAQDEGAAPPPDRSTGRHPIKAVEEAPVAAPEAAPAPVDDPIETESGELVKVKRKKKKKHADPDADAPDAAPVVETPKKAKGEQQFGSRRIQVFLVPIGESASLAAGSTQLALEGEVGKVPGYHPVDLVEELAVAAPAAETAKLEEARRVLGDGNKQLVAHAYEEAVNRFRKAIRTMEGAGFALESAEYADAWTRLAVALQLAGEDVAAREAFQMAARIDLAGVVDGRQVDRKLGAALDSAREEVQSGPMGALSVVTSPAGARVFVGGVYRGTSPVTVDRAPAGVNYVRIDRPGAFPVVQLVEAKEAFDVPVKVRMKFTPEAVDLQKTLVQVPRALGHETGVPDMVKALGTRFRLERAIVATVEMEKTNVAGVRMCVFDFPKDARLADEKQTFVLDVEGGLEEAIGKWARVVLDKADGSRNRAAKDPLERSDGTEGWYSTTTLRAKAEEPKDDKDTPEWERSNYKPTSARKADVKSKDPLDHSDGTEDW